MLALTFGLAGDRCGGRTFSLSAAASNRGGSRGPCSNDETGEVGGDPAVWEDHCRFGQDLFFGVSAGNVVEDKLLYVAFECERSRFRRGEMSVVACHLRISIEKRRLDHQHVGIADVFGQPIRGFSVADDDELFCLGGRTEDVLRIDRPATIQRRWRSLGQHFAYRSVRNAESRQAFRQKMPAYLALE